MFSRIFIVRSFKRALSKSALPRVVSLRDEYPALFELATPLNPKSMIEGHVPLNQMLLWKCPNGADHEWSMPVSDMIKRLKHGTIHGTISIMPLSVALCPFCTGGRISETNCIAGNFPLLEEEWDPKRNGGLLPGRVTYGSTQQYWWNCKCGEDHHYLASPNRRTDLNLRNVCSPALTARLSLLLWSFCLCNE